MRLWIPLYQGNSLGDLGPIRLYQPTSQGCSSGGEGNKSVNCFGHPLGRRAFPSIHPPTQTVFYAIYSYKNKKLPRIVWCWQYEIISLLFACVYNLAFSEISLHCSVTEMNWTFASKSLNQKQTFQPIYPPFGPIPSIMYYNAILHVWMVRSSELIWSANYEMLQSDIKAYGS